MMGAFSRTSVYFTQPRKVTCTFTVAGHLSHVFYNQKDITNDVTGAKNEATVEKRVTVEMVRGAYRALICKWWQNTDF